MVVSEIRSLYRDENDLLRTVIKRIWEEWDAEWEQWNLKRIEFIFENPELPVPSDNHAVAVEQRHGWLILPEWEFQSEVWEYERKPIDGDRGGRQWNILTNPKCEKLKLMIETIPNF